MTVEALRESLQRKCSPFEKLAVWRFDVFGKRRLSRQALERGRGKARILATSLPRIVYVSLSTSAFGELCTMEKRCFGLQVVLVVLMACAALSAGLRHTLPWSRGPLRPCTASSRGTISDAATAEGESARGEGTRIPKFQLQMKVLRLPAQDDVGLYEQLVKQEVGEERVVRWYIARMDRNQAVVEVVYEDYAQ